METVTFLIYDEKGEDLVEKTDEESTFIRSNDPIFVDFFRVLK